MEVSSLSKKHWRVVTDHHPARSVSKEDVKCSNLGQTDERTIYEQGQEQVGVDFGSITMNGGLDSDMIQQRLHNVARQRHELQQLEVQLSAQLMARSEIMEMQDSCDAQIKEHANAAVNLQEQLQERERTIHELERKLEEKDRELHAMKLANEAAWAKEDLLREQNKDLATFRRELDNSEAERSHHLQQMHNLQEHIQDKERQFLELQEQSRVAQETIIYKEGQLRDAQAWIVRVQEMDSLHPTENHSLKAELQQRTEQYNQLWLGCQRQFAEMERYYLHTIQQLQLQLADTKERSGAYTNDGVVSQTKLKDESHFGQYDGGHINVNGNDTSSGNHGVLPNGNTDYVPSYVSYGNASTQVAVLQPFVMHEQGDSHTVPSQVSQSDAGYFNSVPAISSLQDWQHQQAVPESSQSQDQFQPSQGDQNLLHSDTNYNYEISVNKQDTRPNNLDTHITHDVHPDSVFPLSTEESQVLKTLDEGCLVSHSHPSLQQLSLQFHDAFKLNPIDQTIENKEKNVATLTNHEIESQSLTTEELNLLAKKSPSETSMHSVKTTVNKTTAAELSEAHVAAVQTNTVMVEKTLESSLLDERSLLAYIVRTIPPGGRIRISSTLPNRLMKMLAPLHWHDYKKKYGKLEDFVSSHPELFVIEGDFIQLREGAKEMIAATAAVAKVAAAAAASSPYATFLPSVAVTPLAQPNHLKKNTTIGNGIVGNGTNFHGKQQTRKSGAAPTSR